MSQEEEFVMINKGDIVTWAWPANSEEKSLGLVLRSLPLAIPARGRGHCDVLWSPSESISDNIDWRALRQVEHV